MKEKIAGLLGFVTRRKYEYTVKEYEKRISLLEKQVKTLSENLKSIQSESQEEYERTKNLQEISDTLQEKNRSLQERLDQLQTEKVKTVGILKEQGEGNMPMSNKNDKQIAQKIIDLIRFCELLKYTPDITVDECLSLIHNKHEETLKSIGVTIKKEAKGEFSSSCQRIVEVLHTDDATLEGRVASVARYGFWLGEYCLVPQDVVIYSTND